MKMTIDQWNLILSILEQARNDAERLYESRKQNYDGCYKLKAERNPELSDREIVKILSPQMQHYRDAWDRKCEIEAIISKLENTEI